MKRFVKSGKPRMFGSQRGGRGYPRTGTGSSSSGRPGSERPGSGRPGAVRPGSGRPGFDRAGESHGDRGSFGGRGRVFERRGPPREAEGGRGHFLRREKPEMHDAVCAKCHQKCSVPFKPIPGKPVFCRNCYTGDEKKRPSNVGEELAQINDKLDKILKALHLD